MAVDMQEILTANLGAVVQQGTADNQRMAQFLQLGFAKDLFQGGQGETPVVLAGMNSADRTPALKAA